MCTQGLVHLQKSLSSICPQWFLETSSQQVKVLVLKLHLPYDDLSYKFKDVLLLKPLHICRGVPFSVWMGVKAPREARHLCTVWLIGGVVKHLPCWEMFVPVDGFLHSCLKPSVLSVRTGRWLSSKESPSVLHIHMQVGFCWASLMYRKCIRCSAGQGLSPSNINGE